MMRYRHPCSAARDNRGARYAITAAMILVGVLACQASTPTLIPTTTSTTKSTPTLAAATQIAAPTRSPTPTPKFEPTSRASAKPVPTHIVTPFVAPTRTPTSAPTMVPPLPSTRSPEPVGKPLVEVSDVSCASGQEANVDVRLSRVGDGGLAGYDMALVLEPKALAKFVAVEFPKDTEDRVSYLTTRLTSRF